MLSGAGFSLWSGRLLESAFQPQMEMVLIRAHFAKDLHIPKRPGHFDFLLPTGDG